MTDTTNRVAGTAYFSADGVNYNLEGSFKYSPALVKRETKGGQDSIHGYSEMPVAPFVSGSFRDSQGLTVADFNAMTNVTISVQLANGKTIIGRNMWTVDALEVDSEEAKFDVKWEGLQGAVTEN
jgi:hypothetical protein